MSFRSNYWSCSRFADWLRGTMKPNSETSRGWHEWKNQAKQAHPVRYWIAEEGLDIVQDVLKWIPDRLYSIKYYVNNRWVTRTHALTAHPRDIKPGTWCDVGYRFLPCLFNELVDFVEIEQAWHHVVWDSQAREQFKTPWWAHGWWRWRTWRCPAAGLAYLDWASKLIHDESHGFSPTDEGYGSPTLQAISAREILALYHWWKEVYPHRPDPYEVSGWSQYCQEQRETTGYVLPDSEDETPDQREKTRRMLDHINKTEAEYESEDEEMMIRLIKVRRSLWT